jgi:DNA-binding response OmpR family regulator
MLNRLEPSSRAVQHFCKKLYNPVNLFNPMVNVLIIENNSTLAKSIEQIFVKEGYKCYTTYTGQTALAYYRQLIPDLIIIDLELPDLNGLDLCTQLRYAASKVNSNTGADKYPYILMLGDCNDRENRILAYASGVDDFMDRSFNATELRVRGRALLRREMRTNSNKNEELITRSIVISMTKRTLFIKKNDDHKIPVDLTGLEFDLLALMILDPGKVWPREDLLRRIWGDDFTGSDRIVDTYVKRLRAKLDIFLDDVLSKRSFIQTVQGIGYSFQDI